MFVSFMQLYSFFDFKFLIVLLQFIFQLFVSAEEKMDKWIARLAQMRKQKLEGEAMN